MSLEQPIPRAKATPGKGDRWLWRQECCVPTSNYQSWAICHIVSGSRKGGGGGKRGRISNSPSGLLVRQYNTSYLESFTGNFRKLQFSF